MGGSSAELVFELRTTLAEEDHLTTFSTIPNRF
jgi:hypothetical protein